MSDHLATYLQHIEAAHRLGNDTEHTHRPALKALLESLDDRIVATNEPKRVACGAPDFVITRKAGALSLGYVEAKDIGVSLDEAKKSSQFKRYLPALSNLLLTDYLEFRWFVDGAERARFRLAVARDDGRLVPDLNAHTLAGRLFQEFLDRQPVRITSAEELARRLARLTHLIRDTIIAAFQTGNASQLLQDWRSVFAQTLLPELADPGREAEFADMFAQTLAYGLFSARVFTGLSARFTLGDAAKLIPKSNPFLRNFFDLITGAQLDDEPFVGFVHDLVTLLDYADMAAVLEDFGRDAGAGRGRDPVVHFYETFLAAYDPALRELRGVYYTPEPVVSYIVASIDWLLREKFALKDGLADKSRMTVTRQEGGKTVEEESHRVLILDPAAGTGTFLFEVIERIRERFEKKNQVGLWPAYVREHLLPRIFGFELLMAPYAVAHFKIALELSARHLPELWREPWAYHFGDKERLNIYLTNTLEDIEHVTQQLGPLAILSKEANAAHEVKRHKPVLVVLGNPPYSGHSANQGAWISQLVRDYYRVDGKPLGEKNPKWLQDDYVKFIRWAQWRLERTGQGILAFITNHGYLDNPTFRGLRQQLMQAFDEIYVLNLHGNSKKQEAAPDGRPDKNVFDIQQGVAIGIFVKLPKTKRTKAGGVKVHHADLWGERSSKYHWLGGGSACSTNWEALAPSSPHYLFIPHNQSLFGEYERSLRITDAMPVNGWGIATRKDYLLVDFEKKALIRRFEDIRRLSAEEAIRRYRIKSAPHWDFAEAKKQLATQTESFVRAILFRPFDERYVYYEKCMIERGDHRFDLMRHLFEENISLITVRVQVKRVAEL